MRQQIKKLIGQVAKVRGAIHVDHAMIFVSSFALTRFLADFGQTDDTSIFHMVVDCCCPWFRQRIGNSLLG